MTETIVSLITYCKRCDMKYRPGMEDIAIIQSYPLNRISIVSGVERSVA